MTSTIHQERIPEWAVALIHFLFGFTLLLKGDTLEYSAYSTLVSDIIPVSDITLGLPIFLIGAVRLTALYVNGRHRATPLWRMYGAIASASVNTMLGLMFAVPLVKSIWITSGTMLGVDMPEVVTPPNTAALTYIVLAALDYYSAGRAGFDNGINKRQH